MGVLLVQVSSARPPAKRKRNPCSHGRPRPCVPSAVSFETFSGTMSPTSQSARSTGKVSRGAAPAAYPASSRLTTRKEPSQSAALSLPAEGILEKSVFSPLGRLKDRPCVSYQEAVMPLVSTRLIEVCFVHVSRVSPLHSTYTPCNIVQVYFASPQRGKVLPTMSLKKGSTYVYVLVITTVL